MAAKVLWVEDDKYWLETYVNALQEYGFELIRAHDASSGWELFEAHEPELALVVVDLAMAPGDKFSSLETHGGYLSGLSLAKRIYNHDRKKIIVALSNADSREAEAWFADKGLCFFVKARTSAKDLGFRLKRLLDPSATPDLKCFIVHGHDHQALAELKRYIAENLNLGDPIVLAEMPSRGMTIIEKFETYTSDASIVFVLATPDDFSPLETDDPETRRARQNVVFELGYFYGKFTRLGGRVIILSKGKIEIPSDISGVVRVDISRGLIAVDAEIRRELSEFI